MQITNHTRFIFKRNQLTISTPSTENVNNFLEAKLVYSYYPEIHKSTTEFVWELAKKYALSAFGHICTQCGNCCRTDHILVLGSDIFLIAHRLGMPLTEFRKKYLRPANTWNELDGYIKLKRGRCPFLKKEPCGKYSCSIYDIRPQYCKLFPAMGKSCDKDPAYLLEFLEEVEIIGDEIKLVINPTLIEGTNVSGTPYVFNCRLKDEHLKGIFQQIKDFAAGLEGELIDLVENAIKKADRIFQRFIENFAIESQKSDFHYKLQQMREIVTDLDMMAAMDTSEFPSIDNLWKKLRKVEAMAKGELNSDKKGKNESRAPGSDSALYSGDSWTIQSLSFFPEVLTVFFQQQDLVIPYPIHLSTNVKIRNAVRNFVRTVTEMQGDQHHLVLSEPDPICYLCGECCSYFGIEIQPSDIRRIANRLNISESECREKYLEVHRYSWNQGDACMKKRRIGDETAAKCIFLEKREDGFYYCSIHEFKPAVCKGFTPHHSLCRKINNIPHWYRLPRNILRMDLSASRLILHTYYSQVYMPGGFEIEWREESALVSVTNELLNTILEAMGENTSNANTPMDEAGIFAKA